MPPRRRSDSVVAYVVESAPSFHDEKFIEQLLHFVVTNDEDSLLTMTAVALGADCYQVDLGQQIVVDTHIDFINFCALRGFGAAKVAHLLKWLAAFQHLVESGGSIQDAKAEMLNFVASEIEEEWKWRRAALAEEASTEVQSLSRAPLKKGSRALEKVEEPDPANALPKENIHLTKEDVGPFCTWLLQGIVQHASLYTYVANHPRLSNPSEELHYFIEVPMLPCPLRDALPPEEVPQEPPLAKAFREVEEQRAEEITRYVRDYEEAMAQEQARRTAMENERDMKILIENKGVKKAVEDVYGKLQIDLGERQKKILRRIMDMEKALGLVPSLQPT
uniref:Uncharacterized protein n=1 Tax=Trypanosoma congolense (strain IL3000) TaxID=1068625 RepID=G0UQC7_TRYCI|nr:conserved hypothetical protein [Trypanosoma congolense IL3000]